VRYTPGVIEEMKAYSRMTIQAGNRELPYYLTRVPLVGTNTWSIALLPRASHSSWDLDVEPMYTNQYYTPGTRERKPITTVQIYIIIVLEREPIISAIVLTA